MAHNDGRSYRPHMSEGPALLSAVSNPVVTRTPATPTSNLGSSSLSPNGHCPTAGRLPQDTQNRTSNSGKPRAKIESRPFRRLQKERSAQVAYLAAQADSEWFRSLPSKVQQHLLSKEEQDRLANWRSSIIFDAADRALYRLNNQAKNSFESVSSLPTSTSFLDSASMASSTRQADSAIGLDDSFYDSFRWLDEDDDIDLSLDDYHGHITKTNNSISTPASPSLSQPLGRQKSSFRRTLSFSSNGRGRNSISSKLPSSSQSSAAPSSLRNSFTPAISRNRSYSRPNSGLPTQRHISQSSLSSLDTHAQYYQDPEARLKLRVYLASPQKFDEAIEFGFPSLDQKENASSPNKPTESRTTRESGRTFFEDDSKTGFPDSNREDDIMIESSTNSPTFPPSNLNQPNPPVKSRTSSPIPNRKFSTEKSSSSRPLQPISLGYVQNSPGSREMTLKMTLTRADLRISDSAGNVSPSFSDPDDPLRLAELPAVDENNPVWDTPVEDKSMVKKMWRKIRKRRG
ncbi:hypothetical protein AJ79_09102 [Helicocarpus griseus UAMH5409]|uniref:Mucin n=1 Tax=Helicocarpus griseus UAMH5409 TaxID=1447875 RepID=A0A2B7WMJ5_9EURO|nr:hypothetical protein AJ79_09102 [Helicocarpus griseus UAMH5409]